MYMYYSYSDSVLAGPMGLLKTSQKRSVTHSDVDCLYTAKTCTKPAVELDVTSSWIQIVAKLLILNLLIFPVAPQSTNPDGFISIDCGGPGGLDPYTGLVWEDDEKYLQAATHLDNTITAKVLLGSQTSVDNQEQIKTAMIFYPDPSPSLTDNPGGLREGDRIPRSKYCYELPVYFNSSEATRNFLLRATFPPRNLSAKDIKGNTISMNDRSARFYFSVDSTYVSTVELDKLSPQTIELIIKPVNSSVFACLVPLEDRSSMPAISALELRPFKAGMYSRSYESQSWGTIGPKSVQGSYLILFSRWNFGGDPNLPSVRYPNDTYDRLWSPRIIPDSQLSSITSERNTTTVIINNDMVRQGDVSYYYPLEVYSTAWVASKGTNMSFVVNLTETRAQSPTPTFYAHLLFADMLDSSSVTTRFIDIFYDPGNGDQKFFMGLSVSRTSDWVEHRRLTFMSDNVTFKIRANGSSDLPALINGIEIYGEFDSVMARTVPDDAEAIGNFAPDRLDRAGDPCLPIPWAWVVCSIELPPRVTQINLTGKGITGDLPPGFGTLIRLTVLDVSNNSFSGGMTRSLGNISTLRVLNLETNNLVGELPTFGNGSLKNLEYLSISNNRIEGSLDSLVAALDSPINDLLVRNNSFSGSIPLKIQNFMDLRSLDLSHNQFSGVLGIDLVELKNLQTLNLSDNSLEGTVPDSVWSISSLESADLDRNNFTEVNLTTWYLAVTKARSFDNYEGRRKVRLVGNPFQHIILPSLNISIPEPSQVEKQSELGNAVAFILLGDDNPWCKQQKRPRSLTVRYLCRRDERTDFWAQGDDGLRKTLIIVGVTSGLFMLVVLCLFAYVLWRIRRRTIELHQIQEALAKENVKPPFFNYEVLKTATRSFSVSSILGSGGFGTVYKAELPDGTVLAVKRLIPTEQNTSDFLKEMVNIIGIKHRHLVQLKGCCVRERQQRMLVYEYAENKNLAEALWGPEKPFVLSWKQRFNICLGIARGLAYLHEELHPKMVHRDIKPQNILLDKDYNAKIADFGLVRPAEEDNTQITFNIGGTRGYCPPEYINEGMVSEKLDTYSFGIVVLEIVSGRACINYDLPADRMFLRSWALELYGEEELLKIVDKELTEYNEEEVLLVLQTALACCQLDSKKRPSMSQVVNIFMQYADVAIEIVKEVRGQLMDSIPEDDTRRITDDDEADYRGLLSWNTRSSSLGPASIQLSAGMAR